MTQIEFENQVREMRSQMKQELNHISQMQNDTKEEIAALNHQINNLQDQVTRLKMQKQALHSRRLKIEKKWTEKIDAFNREWWDKFETTDSTISDYTLVKILARRGWRLDNLHNDDPDMAEDHKKGVVAKYIQNVYGISTDNAGDNEVSPEEQ